MLKIQFSYLNRLEHVGTQPVHCMRKCTNALLPVTRVQRQIMVASFAEDCL